MVPIFRNVLRNRWVAWPLREVPGIKHVHGSLTFPRRLVKKGDELKIFDDVGKTDAATIFGKVYQGMTPRKQKLLRGLISNIKGAAANDELAKLARNARLTLNRIRGARAVGKTKYKSGKWKEKGRRNFDEFTEEGFKILFNTFLIPLRGRGGTLLEFKAGKAIGSAPQRANTIRIEKIAENGELIETIASAEQMAAAAEAVRLARTSYKNIPQYWFSKNIRRLSKKHVGDEKIKLTEKDVDHLVKAARQWHYKVRREKLENINLGQALIALSMEAQAIARANSVIETKMRDP